MGSTTVVQDKIALILEKKFAEWIALTESFLEKCGVGEVCNSLSDPARYALLGSGKRIRASLSLAVAEIFSINSQVILPFAASLELVHAASLMHDDLPCIDNDDFRRGKPSCHKEFGEGMTVIAGDYLIARAISLIADASLLTDRQKLDLIAEISKATEELCDGQALDLKSQCTTGKSEVSSIDLKNELYNRHLKKTAALFTTAVAGPAHLLSCNGQQNIVSSLRNFGLRLGLLFQIVDDVLDQIGSADQIGKVGKSDSRLGLSTYVTLYGLDDAVELAHVEADGARQALKELPVDPALLLAFVDKIINKIK